MLEAVRGTGSSPKAESDSERSLCARHQTCSVLQVYCAEFEQEHEREQEQEPHHHVRRAMDIVLMLVLEPA